MQTLLVFPFPCSSHLQPGVPVRGDIRRAWLDVVAVLATHVAGRVVVANCEVRSDIAADTNQTSASAVLCVASNSRRLSPDNLGEVAIPMLAWFKRHKHVRHSPPVLKVREAGVGKTVLAGIPVDLAVVEEIRDDSRDIVSLDTGSNVLTISSTADLGVVAVVAGLGPVLRSLDESGVPGGGRSGVVAAVDVVVVEGNVGVAG